MDAREKILVRARALMLRQGFHATTVDGICAHAKVTKGAFFHHFKSKDDLAKEVLAFHCRLTGGRAAQAAYRSVSDPLERVLAYADFTVVSVADPVDDGCLVGVFSSELSRSRKPIREMCAGAFSSWSDDLKAMLEEVGRGRRAGEFDARALADYFIAVFEGALILSKARNDLEPLRTGIRLWKDHVRNLCR